MSGGKKQTIAREYNATMHISLCHGPIDGVTRITFDDDKVVFDSPNNPWKYGTLEIYAPEIFGGESREGGVSGFADMLTGEPTQGQNAHLADMCEGPVPAYRGRATMVFRGRQNGEGFYWGNSNQIKKMSIRAQRVDVTGLEGSPQWYPEKAEIGEGRMNPAHIIYECLTSQDFGCALFPADLEDANFRAMADVLYDEDFGLCFYWTQDGLVEDFIKVVLAHIDGVLYLEPTTGRFNLKLMRDDYTTETLPALDGKDIRKVTDYVKPELGELTNTLTVKFRNMETGADDSVTVNDISLIQEQGTDAPIGTDITYKGAATPELAMVLASRDLKAGSIPLISCKLQCTRKRTSLLRIGDVFKLTWPKLGIEEVVMRITDVDWGSPLASHITISCTQDIFKTGTALFAPTPPTLLPDPISDPEPVADTYIREAPYWDVAQIYGDTIASELDDTECYVVATGVKPTKDAFNAGLHMGADQSNLSAHGYVDFTPYAVNANEIPLPTEDAPTIVPMATLANFSQVAEGTYCTVNDEVLRVGQLLNEGLELYRGVLDSVPVVHPAGSTIYFADDFIASDLVKYAAAETVYCKLTTVTSRGELALDDAALASTVTDSRLYRPYPPAKVQINTAYYPAAINGAAGESLAVVWASRNRLTQTSVLFDWFDDDVAPEANTQYNYSVLNEDGVEIAAGTTSDNFFTVDEVTEKTQLNKFTYPLRTNVFHAKLDYIQTVIDDGPVSYWQFDETAGTTANDTMGTLDGVINGGVTLNQPGLQFSGGTSFLFNGTSGFVEIDDITREFRNTDFTIETWFNCADTAGLQSIFSISQNNGDIRLALYIDNGSFMFATPSGASSVFPANAGHTYHAIVTYDRSENEISVYLNSALIVDRQSESLSFANNDRGAIGAYDDDNVYNYFFNGNIDDFSVYDYVLSVAQITNHNQSGDPVQPKLRFNNFVTVSIETERDGFPSAQQFTHAVDRSGYGYNYGKHYGA